MLVVLSLLLLPTGSQAQWVQTNLPSVLVCWSLAVNGTYAFAGCSNPDYPGSIGVWVSTDNGANWTLPSLDLQGVGSLNDFAFIGPYVFTAKTFLGVFRSTDNGTKWTAVNSGLTRYDWVGCLAVVGTNLFAGNDSGVFLSTNNGDSWKKVSSGLPGGGVGDFAVIGTNIFAAATGGVYRSTNNGTSWAAVNSGLTNLRLNCLAVGGTNLYAGTTTGIFRSTDNGTSWTLISGDLGYYPMYSILVTGPNIFVGTLPALACLSTDNGATWGNINTGLTPYYIVVDCFAISGPYLLAGARTGISGFGVWRRPLSEMIVDVRDPSTTLPSQYSLEQNYPNPFNPSTTIEFSIPKPSYVTLKVFNVLGNEMATLVNGRIQPGIHSVRWNASGVPSGVYFCRLAAGEFSGARKLILQK